MKNHVKVYMNHFGYGMDDCILCEMGCGKCIDIHHLDGRGPGKDVIEKLMGLCRDEHIKAGASPEYNDQLKQIHLNFLKDFNRKL